MNRVILTDFEYQVAAQDIGERTIQQLGQSTLRMNLTEHDMIRPDIMAVSELGDIFIFDHSDMNLYCFSRHEDDFSGPKTLGTGRGRGPTDFSNPVDMKPGTDNDVLILDSPNARIVFYSCAGDLLSEIKLDNALEHRLAPLPNGNIVLKSPVRSGHNLFTMIKPDAESKLLWGKHDNLPVFYTEGFIHADEKHITYFPLGLSRFYTFTHDGALKYAREIIEPGEDNEIERIETTGEGVRITRRPPDFKFINFSLTIFDGLIYTLYSGDKPGAGSNIIDVYDVETGEYQHSFKSEYLMIDLHVTDAEIIILAATQEGTREVIAYQKP